MTGRGSRRGSRLRVAHLVDRYLSYSETWLHRQVVGCSEVDPHVVAFQTIDDGPARFPVPALTVLDDASPVPYRASRSVGSRWRLTPQIALRGLREWSPDVAHAHFANTAWEYLPVVRRLGIPFVVSVYGRDVGALPRAAPKWRSRYGELFGAADIVLCEGPVMRATVVGLGCPEGKARLQRLGVDTTRFLARDRRLSSGSPLRALMVGRFVEKKGVPDAIAAVALAARTVPITLTIVGDADPNAEQELARIREAVDSNGAQSLTTFAGRLSHQELSAFQADFHVVLQPSRQALDGDTEGGAPVGLIELAASGLPAVATRHADIPEVVADLETGLLADEGDVAGLAAHLVHLATHPEQITTMGRAAAARARELFDDGECLSQLRAQYESLVRPGV